MAIGEQALPPKQIRGGSSAGVATFLAVVAVGGGLYVVSQRAERPVAPKNDNLAQVAALARVEKDSEWLQRAIRERQAILGMTYREVEQAKGVPRLKQRGDVLPEIHRAKGGVETWSYDAGDGRTSTVIFGANGLVIKSSDVGDPPRAGQAIRQ
jgi:hypothetical protein